MIYFKLKFCLDSGSIVEALIENEGLSLADVRQDVVDTINDEGIYTLLNVLSNEWIVVQGNKIEAFSIEDLGQEGLKLAQEGFIFK